MTRRPGAPAALDAATAFAFLWAAAALFHQAKWANWAASPVDLALSATALWLLVRPWSTRALALLVVASIAYAVVRAPWINNHWMLVVLVDVAIGIALVHRALAGERGIDRMDVYRAFAPAARLVTIVFYMWTAFHKLNVDYLDPATGCGAVLYGQVARRFGLPDAGWAAAAAGPATLAAELAIPLLLVPRRTRGFGLLLAAGFHYALGLAGYFNFSAVLYALLFLFLPEDVPGSALRAGRASAPGRRIERALPEDAARLWLRATRWAFAAAVVFLLWNVHWDGPGESFRLLYLPEDGERPLVSYPFEVLWWVLAPLLVAAAALGVRAGRGEWPPPARLLALPRPVYAIPVLLVFANGLAPYVGLKTETAFSMFSNLRTEGATTNHLLVRRPLPLAGFQDDLVAIESSTDRELERLARRDLRIPAFELRSYVDRRRAAGGRPFEVRWRRDGGDGIVTGDATGLDQPVPAWLRKVLRFRPVPPAGAPAECVH